MVTYPDLSSVNSSLGIGGILALPNSSYPFFWAWILFGLFIITTTTLYFKEKEQKGRANILSSMVVASISIVILALIGTVAGFISLEIMVYILVLSFLIIGIWFFSN